MSNELQLKDQRTFSRRLKDARLGDPSAQYEVALMYANGVGVAKSVDQAMVWTAAAAQKGHVAAQYLLGKAYQGGLGVKRNTQQALTWLLRATDSGSEKAPLRLYKMLSEDGPAVGVEFLITAAERGMAEAQFEVAQGMTSDSTIEKPSAAAVLLYQKAAQGGLAAAQVALAQALERANPSRDQLAQATRWYREAASQGHPGAQLALARMDGWGVGRSPAVKRSSTSGKSQLRKKVGNERRLRESPWDHFAGGASPLEQFHLAQMYQQGCGVSQDSIAAKNWFERAAQSGLLEAQLALAELFSQNAPAQSLYWYEKAAEQGSSQALLEVARHAAAGISRSQSLTRALGFYAQAALKNNPEAQQELSLLVRHHGLELADDWLVHAAREGLAQAQYELGDRYAKGLRIEQDWVLAADWFARAAAQGNAPAQCALGACFADGLGVKKDFSRAIATYEGAALQDHPRALWALGELLAQGGEGIAADPRKAALYCKRAANAGFAPAQSTLAALFAAAKKYERAVHWWRMAAEQDDPEALFNLSHAYKMGWATAREDESLVLLQRAADTGLVAAQARLGLCYATGDTAPLDPVEAAKWFILAARSGDAAATKNCQRSESTLAPAQWREAQRRALRWTTA